MRGIFREGLNHRQLLGSLLDLEYTVETRIANDGDIRDANLSQQFLAHLVLHEEMGEAVEHRRGVCKIVSRCVAR